MAGNGCNSKGKTNRTQRCRHRSSSGHGPCRRDVEPDPRSSTSGQDCCDEWVPGPRARSPPTWAECAPMAAAEKEQERGQSAGPWTREQHQPRRSSPFPTQPRSRCTLGLSCQYKTCACRAPS
ncbi:hypothetical protein BC828DRAFT_39025 [Blastocladiella britannica]|nr:hypothetical protein BC828DRAFT_39025 [Blastocladiella britannica]